MKIIITEIPSEGLEINLLKEGRFDFVNRTSPYEANLKVFKKGNDVVITGQVKCSLELQCSRCLNPFRLTINSPLDITFRPAGEIAEEGCYEIQRDELDVSFYSNNMLDIDDIINEQLALNIPMKPLCDIECKGLCIQCGADLNKTQCICKISGIDERFKVLEKLIKKKE